MAFNARVGKAVLELTTDSASYDAAIATARTNAKALGGEWKQTAADLRAFTQTYQGAARQVASITNEFLGDRKIAQANHMVTAIRNIGGATKLTAAEQSRANATLQDAIAKYTALGQTAPKAMVDLELATRKVTTATSALTAGMSAAGRQSQASMVMIGGMSQAGRQAAAAMQSIDKPASFLTTRMVALGAAAGSFLGNVAFNAVMKLGQGFLEAAANGAKLTAIEGSFHRLADGIGQSGAAMLQVSRTATKGLISDLDLMQSANKAMLLGLPVTAQEMGTLSKAAITLGRAMGLDATTSLDNLITALGRSSPLILDNLGLTVKVGEANEEYARSLGKSASQLTDAERKMAFYRAAMDAAQKKTEELGEVQLGVIDQLKRIGVAVGNTVTEMAAGANESSTFSGALGLVADQAERAAQNLKDVAEARKNLGLQNLPGLGGNFDLMTQMGVGPLAAELRRIQEARSRLMADAGTDKASPLLKTQPTLGPGNATEAEIRKLEEQGKAMQQRFEQIRERMVTLSNSLFGRDLIARGNDLVAVLGDIGNVALLSVEKQREVHEAVTAAIAVYERMGKVVPPQLLAVAEATSQVLVNTSKFTDAYKALPAVITPAAASITGRLLPALHGVEAALENAALRQADLNELLEKGMIAPDLSSVRNDASAEARQIARARLDEQLQEQRDQILAFWRKQGAALANASIGRLGTLGFGQLGHDIDGSLRAAAQEAELDFRKLQRTGKATAKELEVAFERWREAEDRANFTFSERWKQFWGGLKQTFVSILDDMLQYFVGNFLKGLAKGLAGAKLGQQLGGIFGGGVSGGGGGAVAGGLAQMAGGVVPGLLAGGGGGALAAGTVSNGVLVGVGAGGGAGAAPAGAAAGAGGGSFLMNPAFWTNPYTIAVIGGIILGTAIWKKGLFRGGWEGIEGNKRRDRHLLQWGPPGNGPESGRGMLAAFLARKPGGEAILRDFSSGDKKRFESSQQTIVMLAAQAGKKNIKAFRTGTPSLDFMDFGAQTPAELHGQEAVIPRGSGHRLAGEIARGLASLRMPAFRMPSLRMPSLRLPTVQLPSVRLPGMGLPRLGASAPLPPEEQPSAQNPQRERREAVGGAPVGRWIAPARRDLKAFDAGGFVPPGVEQPAVLHGGGDGELAAPIATLADMISDRFQAMSQKGAALFGGPSAELRTFIGAQASLMTTMASSLKGVSGGLLAGFGFGRGRGSESRQGLDLPVRGGSALDTVGEDYERRMGFLGGLVSRLESPQVLMPATAGAPGGGTGPIIVTVTNHNHFSGLVDKDSMDALYEEEIVPRTVRDIKFQLTGLGNAISRVRR